MVLCRDRFGPSPSRPLLPPLLASSISSSSSSIHAPVAEFVKGGHLVTTFSGALWSIAEESLALLPRVELPGEKGGEGIHVEKTVLDAFGMMNATVSLALAGVTSAAAELTRTNMINDFVDYVAGEEEEEDESAAGGAAKEGLPPSLPWEWDRVGHDTVANMTRDCGGQTLTRLIERRTKAMLGHGATYCELLKHAHKAACKEYHQCRSLPTYTGFSAASVAARLIAASPMFYFVRALTGYVADVFVDCVAWLRGQLNGEQLVSNARLKLIKYTAGGALCLAFGILVPFFYPHPYIFIGAEQLGANLLAENFTSRFGEIEPS